MLIPIPKGPMFYKYANRIFAVILGLVIGMVAGLVGYFLMFCIFKWG